MTQRIVLTGAPGSGKTKFVELLRRDPRFADFVFLEELARQLLLENPEFRRHWAEFHREIYRRQIRREAETGEKPFVTDRGTVDAFAFHPETLGDVGTTLEREYERYTAVLHLQSSANLGEEYYSKDAIRNESAADAIVIEKALIEAWKKHPGYRLIPAEENLDDKYQKFLTIVLELIEQ